MISAETALGNRKKIAKFLMRTSTCRSTFLYETTVLNDIGRNSLLGNRKKIAKF
jgi:hypothetical protein